MPRPNFLVAGAARSGTTALIEGLRLHPDVFVTRPKEPHYFALHDQEIDFRGPGDGDWVNKVVVNDRERYLSLYESDRDYRARGDGSVSTLYYAERSLPEILRVNPEMRVVVLLREPVERAFSSYTYLRLRGMEPEADFRVALADENRRREANWHHLWHYTGMSHYADDLEILLDGLGRDRVGVWFYDDLQSDYQRVLGEVAAFLDLPPFPQPPTLPKVNASGTARLDVAQRAIRWATRNQAVRAAVKRVVPFRSRERIRSSLIRTDVIPPDIASELEPLFADDLKKLTSLVDGPRPQWLERYAEPVVGP
jgi:Sulfotransferase family